MIIGLHPTKFVTEAQNVILRAHHLVEIFLRERRMGRDKSRPGEINLSSVKGSLPGALHYVEAYYRHRNTMKPVR